MTKKVVRVLNGGGFWGDDLHAAVQLIEQSLTPASPQMPVYLTMDYLAEVTMGVLAKLLTRQKQKPGNNELPLEEIDSGYAHDFVALMQATLSQLVDKQVRVLVNAGGLNPRACARAISAVAKELGVEDSTTIAVIDGDDISERIPEILSSGQSLRNLSDNKEFGDEELKRLLSANVYLGAEPIVSALHAGANIVITGRVSDASLPLAAMAFEHGWSFSDFDKLAAGTIAGHIIECGAQASGGNNTASWRESDLSSVGYPFVDVEQDGAFIVSKAPNSGGVVSEQTVKLQLGYEIQDPTCYLGPDVSTDFTSAVVEEIDQNRVRVSNACGQARPEQLKVSISLAAGYMASGTLIFWGADAWEKAQAEGKIIEQRLEERGLQYDDIFFELIGSPPSSEISTPGLCRVALRVAVCAKDKALVTKFTEFMPSLVLNSVPDITGYTEAKGRARGNVEFWGALISRESVQPQVTVLKNEKGQVTWEAVEFTSSPSSSPKSQAKSESSCAETQVRALKPGERLGDIAYGRSGDKGRDANICVFVYDPADYSLLLEKLTATRVKKHFEQLDFGFGPIHMSNVIRFEMKNLHGLNFLLKDVLNPLWSDHQGKGFWAYLANLTFDAK